MSRVREERVVLAAAALIAMGRDDRLTCDQKAEAAAKQADATLSALDATEQEEDSDSDVDDERYEAGYETGVQETEARLDSVAAERDELLAELAQLKAEHEKELAAAKTAAFNDGVKSVTPAAAPAKK